MSGRWVKTAVRALDAVAHTLGRARSMPAHLATGRRGEQEAYFYLRKLGYVMVARNWRTQRRRGEVDLIGWDGDTLCFIEVKTRSTREVKPAEAAVDAEKREELSRMAQEYRRRGQRRSGRMDPEIPAVRLAKTGITPADLCGSAAGRRPANFRGSADASKAAFRFDVVSVYTDAEPAEVTLFKNAFGLR